MSFEKQSKEIKGARQRVAALERARDDYRHPGIEDANRRAAEILADAGDYNPEADRKAQELLAALLARVGRKA